MLTLFRRNRCAGVLNIAFSAQLIACTNERVHTCTKVIADEVNAHRYAVVRLLLAVALKRQRHGSHAEQSEIKWLVAYHAAKKTFSLYTYVRLWLMSAHNLYAYKR